MCHHTLAHDLVKRLPIFTIFSPQHSAVHLQQSTTEIPTLLDVSSSSLVKHLAQLWLTVPNGRGFSAPSYIHNYIQIFKKQLTSIWNERRTTDWLFYMPQYSLHYSYTDTNSISTADWGNWVLFWHLWNQKYIGYPTPLYALTSHATLALATDTTVKGLHEREHARRAEMPRMKETAKRENGTAAWIRYSFAQHLADQNTAFTDWRFHSHGGATARLGRYRIHS